MPDLFIDGTWRGALDERTREIRCPADGSLVGIVDEAGGKDTVEAVLAARRAFDTGPWPHTSARERGDLLPNSAGGTPTSSGPRGVRS